MSNFHQVRTFTVWQPSFRLCTMAVAGYVSLAKDDVAQPPGCRLWLFFLAFPSQGQYLCQQDGNPAFLWKDDALQLSANLGSVAKSCKESWSGANVLLNFMVLRWYLAVTVLAAQAIVIYPSTDAVDLCFLQCVRMILATWTGEWWPRPSGKPLSSDTQSAAPRWSICICLENRSWRPDAVDLCFLQCVRMILATWTGEWWPRPSGKPLSSDTQSAAPRWSICICLENRSWRPD